MFHASKIKVKHFEMIVEFAVGKASYSSYVYVNFRLWHSELYFSAEIEEQDFCL